MHKIKLLLFLLIISINCFGNNPDIWSKSGIVVDGETEQILFEKNSHLIVPPASMTKLVTLYIVYKEIEKGNLSYKVNVPVSYNADWRNLPKDSSLMFLKEGDKVTLYDLMEGLAVPSGNDAAIAIAEYISGSTELFVKRMNLEMAKLGFKTLHFVDPSGFNDDNEITVNEFVQFIMIFNKEFPHSIDDLFTKKSYTYNGIKQYNHNPMIGLYRGCDGLKTGFIYKSGLNISLTAKKGDRRVFIVLSGVMVDNKEDAERKRIVDSSVLLNYAFSSFYNTYLDKIILPGVFLPKSNEVVTPVIPFKSRITLGSINDIRYKIDRDRNEPDAIIGKVFFKMADKEFSFPF